MYFIKQFFSDIIYIYIYIYIHTHTHACVCIYIYIIYTAHIHILCKQILLFWMRLIVINRLTALKQQTKLLLDHDK